MIAKLELLLRHVTLSFHLGMFYINFSDIIYFERETIKRRNEVFMLWCASCEAEDNLQELVLSFQHMGLGLKPLGSAENNLTH